MKQRADVALVQRGLAESREKAQAAILAGEVWMNGGRIRKSSEMIREEDELELRSVSDQYVSRGALKLEKAVQVFHADFRNRVVMDVGASTGGFTDVCLRAGARRVYAIDVGYGQLSWKLRNDPRVVVMERTNARYLTPEVFDERPEMAVMDVSFISICLVLPALFRILGESGVVYTLIKPQFEAGREQVGKKGVVRDAAVHEAVIRRIRDFLPAEGWEMVGLSFSPITGPEGNMEFLAELRPAGHEGKTEVGEKAPAEDGTGKTETAGDTGIGQQEAVQPVSDRMIAETVARAHETLGKNRE